MPLFAALVLAQAIRVYGSGLGGLVEKWEAAFARVNPGVRFENTLPTSDAALPALVTGAGDLGPDGGEATLTEKLAFFEVHGHLPTAITVASGAYDAPGKSNGLVVFVHKDNPVSKLTVEQLDGIFGAARTAGMRGFEWTPSAGRDRRQDIRTWGELGLEGEWASRPIQTYGHAPSGTARFFQWKVLDDGDKWNPNYREYVETGSKMISPEDRPQQRLGLMHMLAEELAHDKYGIAFTVLPQAKGISGIKPVALAPRGGGAFVSPSRQSFVDRSYPLVRDIYFFVDRVNPKLAAFIRFVLSPEGQQIVERDGGYLPLPMAVAREQLKKLEASP